MFTPTANDSRDRHLPMLSAIMLGVLLAGVGAAWLMVRLGRDTEVYGAEIMADIRREGLAAHWTGHPRVQWYLIREVERQDDGTKRWRPAGWQASILEPAADGGFDGAEIQMRLKKGGRAELHCQRWRLNADATSGQYRAFRLGRGARGSGYDTEIRLGSGRLDLEQAQFGKSHAAAPDNYMPEGTLDLACYLAARAGRRTQFSMVLDSVKPDGQTTSFARITVKNAVATADGWRVLVRRGSLENYYFDSKGLLVRRVGGGVDTLAVAPQDVESMFPGAAATVQRAIEQTQLPRTRSQTQPTVTDSPPV